MVKCISALMAAAHSITHIWQAKLIVPLLIERISAIQRGNGISKQEMLGEELELFSLLDTMRPRVLAAEFAGSEFMETDDGIWKEGVKDVIRRFASRIRDLHIHVSDFSLANHSLTFE